MISFRRPAALLWVIAGFVVWSAAFLLLYGLHALACEWGWGMRRLGPVNLLQVALLAVWGVNVAVLCAVTALAWRSRGNALESNGGRGILRSIFLSLSLAAMVSTVWIGVPILAVPTCD